MAPRRTAASAASATKKETAEKADSSGRVTKPSSARQTAQKKTSGSTTTTTKSPTKRKPTTTVVASKAAVPSSQASKGIKETKATTTAPTKGADRGRKTNKSSVASAESNASVQANTKRKRARSPSSAAEDREPDKKKAKATPEPKVPRKVKAAAKPKAKVVINSAPTDRLEIYVCGAGSQGELGLGANLKALDVTRPRLNTNLAPDTVGVVALACGGMHCIALTHDNKILTWGVNDNGALGRHTPPYEGKMVDADASDSEEEDEAEESGLNPLEATPTPVPAEHFPEGTKFVQVAASDSASFVLTDDGLVYGWGLFRDPTGNFGFSLNADGTPNVSIQRTPMLIQGLKDVVSIDAGADHVVVLDKRGHVFAWGAGANGQLGRRPSERHKYNTLKPSPIALPKNKITSISCGTDHSFAITKDGEVYSWGLNNRCQCGIPAQSWDDNSVIFKPQKVEILNKPIKMVAGGNKNSIACTRDGEALTFGQCSVGLAGTMNIPIDDPEAIVKNARGQAEIALKPLKVDKLPGKAVFVTSASDTDIAITEEGKVYSWGFNGSYALGIGCTTNDDIYEPQLVEHKDMKDKKIVWAGSGGQFSVFANVA